MQQYALWMAYRRRLYGILPHLLRLTAAVWHTALEGVTQYAICIFNGILQYFVDVLKMSIKGVFKILSIFSILHNRKPQKVSFFNI
jgi:hypothetical protein